jgi:hypothetical protein
MSYDIYVVDENKETITLEKPHQLRGGTYCESGTTEAHYNITYNYSVVYYMVFPRRKSIGLLDGKTLQQADTIILKAMSKMPDFSKRPREGNYWEPTPQNAWWALRDLHELFSLIPEEKRAIARIRVS